MYPHNAIRSNTIFEVVKSRGRAYRMGRQASGLRLVNGPSGHGVDDLYTPEITNAPGFDNTVSVVCTIQNDYLKVQGILNEIHGLTHDGKPGPGVPAVFGMNFQGVSVGQKLEKDKLPVAAPPTPIRLSTGSRAAIRTGPERRPRFWPTACARSMTRWAA